MKRKPSLKRLVNKWIPILKIRDWDITYTYGRKTEYEDFNESEAFTVITPSLRKAQICILDPLDYDPDTVIDIEATVLHELLHVVFYWSGYGKDHANYLPWEQSMEATAQALIELDRRGKKSK